MIANQFTEEISTLQVNHMSCPICGKGKIKLDKSIEDSEHEIIQWESHCSVCKSTGIVFND